MKATFRILSLSFLVVLCLALTATAQRRGGNRDAATPAADSGPKDPLENLRFRNLGPAAGGGRVAAVAGIPGNPNVYYIGAAAGGVFKTTDGGLSWRPIFEKEAIASIGAIALAPSNPNLVWVGTGESNIRNDVATGKGVYLSTDAGSSWKFMGLKNAGQIANIVIDPNNPNIVFVGVLGHAWGPNPDRGVFRTTDGGKTWDKVLYVNDTTGVSDLIIDPTNPMVLYAAMWQMVRHPWMMDNGGPGSGIYRSVDGGSTWKRLSEGLPEGNYGNIGIAVSPSNPRHLYALVEAKRGLLWDSQDMGDHWREVSNNHALDARPFYFSEMMVSPNDENRVYFLSYDILASNDGGKSAQVIGRGVHPDNHSIWIDPKNPERIILGNDGGVYVSHDTGRNWRFLNNLPIEQFYQVAADEATPYMLCGGLQDNNGWCGASNTVNRSGIGESDWFTVVGGDGEYVVPAPGTSKNVYADSQNGFIQRVNVGNGLSKSLRPYFFGVGDKKPSDLKYRFNWTTPIAVNPTSPDEIYMGGNVIFKSTDGGAHWKPISPDLTRNDKTKQESSGGIELDLSGAETFGTVLSFSLAPSDPKVIWAGTDDGVIQVTKDGGENWANVTPKGLPEWGRLQQIEASPFDPGTAYAAVDFHEIDNDRPFVYKTHDFGKTWTAIADGLPDDAPARVIRENPNRKGFLVLGTETGLYYSYDDGAKWTSLKSNFPTVPVYDIKFIKKNHDLVVATHGRGLFVMDNITPLEESTGDNAFHVYSIRTANHWHFWNKGGFSAGSFVAPNPPSGASIDYYLPAELKATPEQRRKREGPVKITIADADGKLVRTLYGPSKMGYNRASWDLRYSGPKQLNFIQQNQGGEEENPFFNRNAGPSVVPGTYKVTIAADGKSETKTVEVALDPRFPNADVNAFKAQVAAALEVRDEQSALNEALNRINSLKKQIGSIEELLGTPDENGVQNVAYKPVLDQARAMRKKLDALETPIYNHDIQPGASDDLHYLSRFQNRLQRAGGAVNNGYAEAPSELALEEMAEVRKELDQHLKEINEFLNTEVVAFNKLAIEKGSSTLFAGSPITVKSGNDSAPGAQEEDDDNQ